MLTVRRASERRVERTRDHESWSTFGSGREAGVFAGGFFALEALDEVSLPPSATLPASLGRDVELVTYLLEGEIAFEDAAGHVGVIAVGEVHRQTLARGACLGEGNASSTSWARAFRLAVRGNGNGSGVAGDATSGPLLFTIAERRNLVRVVASPDARDGSVCLHADVLVCSSVLDRGHHLVHALELGRGGWLHVVTGEVWLNGTKMAAGDGAGVILEPALSVTALENAELLLVDVASTGAHER